MISSENCSVDNNRFNGCSYNDNNSNSDRAAPAYANTIV